MFQLSGEKIASIAVVAGNRAARACAQKRRMGGDAANHAAFEYGSGASAGARGGAGRALSATSAPELPEASSSAAVTVVPIMPSAPTPATPASVAPASSARRPNIAEIHCPVALLLMGALLGSVYWISQHYASANGVIQVQVLVAIDAKGKVIKANPVGPIADVRLVAAATKSAQLNAVRQYPVMLHNAGTADTV